MAELIWTEPTLSDLEMIADYIVVDHPLLGDSCGGRSNISNIQRTFLIVGPDPENSRVLAIDRLSNRPVGSLITLTESGYTFCM